MSVIQAMHIRIQPLRRAWKSSAPKSAAVDDSDHAGDDAHDNCASGALVVERLPDGDDHRDEHPRSRDHINGSTDSGNHAEDAKDPGRRGEPDRAQQLADVSSVSAAPASGTRRRCRWRSPRTPTAAARASRDAEPARCRAADDRPMPAARLDRTTIKQRLAGGRAVGFDFLEDRNVKPCRADRSLKKGHR